MLLKRLQKDVLWFAALIMSLWTPTIVSAASMTCSSAADRDRQAYQIYKTHYDKAVPPNNAMKVDPVEMAKKQHKGEITVSQYLQWRAQYETDLSSLALRQPPEVRISRYIQPLKDQCVETKEIEPVYKSQPDKPPCCRWFQHKRTRITNYRASLRMIKFEYDFVIFKIDMTSLQDRIYKKLSSIFSVVGGGSKSAEAIKTIKEGWDIGESLAKGETFDAAKDTAISVTSEVLKESGYKTMSVVLGPLNNLWDEFKALYKQAKGVINAFGGQEQMVPGKVTYLGNHIYGLRVKGVRVLPEEAFWEAMDSWIETDSKGTSYGVLPCGLSPANVGSSRTWAIPPSVMCQKQPPPGPRPNPPAPGGGGGGPGGGGPASGVRPRKIPVPPIITGSGRKWPRFEDPCQQKAFKTCRFRQKNCRRFSDEQFLKEQELRALIRRMNALYDQYRRAQRLKARNPNAKAAIRKKIERMVFKAWSEWRKKYATYQYLKKDIAWLKASYQACLKSCLQIANQTAPCPGGSPEEDAQWRQKKAKQKKAAKRHKWRGRKRDHRKAKDAPQDTPKDLDNLVCAIDGLESLTSCRSHCKVPCRYKKTIGDVTCYECPSGSPDSCYDVNALPADHAWCQPGGICYDDPMLYCEAFNTVGPQLEKLSCKNCKKRPDLCWQKVQNGTTTLTNCRLSCWDGTCEYRGRYDEMEWDGRAEWIHCFECVTPPPPPTCEELGWGHDWESDCDNQCADPGYCAEFRMPDGKKVDDPKDDGQEGDEQDGDEGERGDGGDDSGGGDAGGGSGGGGGASGGGASGGGTSAGGGSSSGGGAMAGGQGHRPQPPVGGPQGGPASGSGNAGASQGTSSSSSAEKGKTSQPPQDDPEDDGMEIAFYQRWLQKTEERLRRYEEELKDPSTGPKTRKILQRYIDQLTKQRDHLRSRIEALREQERARHAEEKARDEARKKRREASRSRSAESISDQITREIRIRQIKDLREAARRLAKRTKEMKASLTARRNTIADYDRKIKQLTKEIDHFQVAIDEGLLDEDFSRRRIRENQELLRQYQSTRRELAKRLVRLERDYQEELTELRGEYERRLWAVDKEARQRTEIQRIDEYYETLMELRRHEASMAVAEEAWNKIIQSLEDRLRRAKKAGDTALAAELEEQLTRTWRGKEDWDQGYARRTRALKNSLDEMEGRNAYEGLGPVDAKMLADRMSRYIGRIERQAAKTRRVIDELEQSGKDPQTIEKLKAQARQLETAVEGLKEKQAALKSSIKIEEDHRGRIQQSVASYAQGALSMEEDKGFVRLFAESLVEETARTLRPDVAVKKGLAFSWGMVKGVASSVKGLGELGLGAADLLAESAAVNLGAEDGWIFGTDASEALYGVLDTVGSHASFDGLGQAAVAAGQVLDETLTRLERSGDVDWAAAELGGRIAGEVILGDEVVAVAVGKLGRASQVADELGDAGRVADHAADVERGVDHAADAVRSADEARSMASRGDTLDWDRPVRVLDEDGLSATSAVNKAEDPVEALERGLKSGTGASQAPPGGPRVDEGIAAGKTDAPPRDVGSPLRDKTDEVVKAAGKTSPKEPRAPPVAKPLDNTREIPKSGRRPKPLDRSMARRLEEQNGFRRDHADKMHQFAQEHEVYLIVRDGNVDSVKHMGNPDFMPKPMSSKAKTAKVGPPENRGLVVDPTHPVQKQYWEDALKAAERQALATGDWSEWERLTKARKKALDSWEHYGEKMKKNGYFVQDNGVIGYKDPETGKVYKGIHGDYDLHGVYKAGPDGKVTGRVSFGGGEPIRPGGSALEDGAVVREQLNKAIDPNKTYIQHGAQDDWIPDPTIVPNKPPDPPATVFFPDGRPPKVLKNAEEMKKFYETEMGIKFDYPDPVKKTGPSVHTMGDNGGNIPKGMASGTGAPRAPPTETGGR